jgi:hypothetical protein
MLQVVASPTIIILKTLEVSFTLLENIYSTSITHKDYNIFIVQATGVMYEGLDSAQKCLGLTHKHYTTL